MTASPYLQPAGSPDELMTPWVKFFGDGEWWEYGWNAEAEVRRAAKHYYGGVVHVRVDGLYVLTTSDGQRYAVGHNRQMALAGISGQPLTEFT